MAVNGVEIEVGQTWVTAGGATAVIFDRVDGNTWEGRAAGKTIRWDNAGRSGFNDLVRLVEVVAKPALWAPRRDTDPKPDANATQVGGSHYKVQQIQPWDFIAANGIGFLAGNVIKYVARFDKKNGVEDLKKARHYLDKLIELEQAK